MHPILAIALFWAFLFAAMLLFGIACIKYGVYTSGNRDYRPTLDV